MIGHPSAQRLVAYVDKSLSVRDEVRVQSHLAGCNECRLYVQRVRKILDLAQQTSTVSPPEDTLEKIRRRQEDGERVILPATEVRPMVKPLSKHIVAVAALVILIGASMTIFAGRVRADHSMLSFSPAKPERGDTVTVEYVSDSRLAGEDSLVLRARYRTASDGQYNRQTSQERVTTLVKKRGGRYVGTFVIPEAVVYAIFAVEDQSAAEIDDNSRILWELMVHDEGVPEPDALVQKSYDLMGRNWEQAYRTARTAERLYPYIPLLTRNLSSFEARLFGWRRADSLRDLNRERYERLNEILATRSSLTDEELAGMYWVALLAEIEADETEYWRRRLLTEAPYHPMAVQDSANTIARLGDVDPIQAFAEFEKLWSTYKSAHARVPERALNLALQIGDRHRAVLWADRLEIVDPWRRPRLALSFASNELVREEGIVRLRDEIRRLGNSDVRSRDLDVNLTQWKMEIDASVQALNAALGKALISSGLTDEGLQLLETASQSGWNRSAFKTIGEHRLASGDAEGAAEMMARVAVDPGTAATVLDSVDAVMTMSIGAAAWDAVKTSARSLMFERTGREAVLPRRIDLALPLVDNSGQVSTLEELVRAKVTLVAFWSQHCAPAVEEMESLEALAEQLTSVGAELVAVTDEQPSPSVSAFLTDVGFTHTTYHDSDGEVATAFNSWATPEYYVLDQRGQIVFELIELENARRYVAYLQRSSALVALRPPVSPIAPT